MKESTFLISLRREITGGGVPVEIAGQKMIVIRPSQNEYLRLLVEAESRAKDAIGERRAQLKREKLTADEMASIRAVPGAESAEFKTRYDEELFTRKLTIFSLLIAVHALRNEDGSKIYEDAAGMEEAIQLISEMPGAEDIISNALQEAEKKRIAALLPKD